jgi:hypothetical protein
MSEQIKIWLIYLGIASPIQQANILIRDRSGLTFTTLLPSGVRTGAYQEGVNLILKSSLEAATPSTIIERIDPIVDRLLNTLRFRLLQDVISIALEIVENKPETEPREMLFFPQYSPLGQGRFQWIGFSYQGGIPNEISVAHSDRVDAAIAWFIRGIRGTNPMDSFAGYWLCLERLASEVPDISLSMRCCGFVLSECPNCGKSTKGAPGMRQRLRRMFIDQLGKDEEYFERVWTLRNFVFHGRREVFTNMLEIATRSHELKAIAVKQIKVAMSIPLEYPPFQDDTGSIVPNMGLFGSYEPS